ncbi:hypothetical protein DFQ10_107138 [Winogradskyella eximia]|jgi:hypothetical protein|uniref:Uncharacterized protein n=1 Tax=Winogradskyella eximia TaxID=262006 RepID=A0A3D9H1B2_9FLAO|nr:hypothetical protein [Winogradskyella eximia]RED42951.1 hypothetical protein DFQ10_107138 [Winogradskyella eximia]|tara:strand:+ start:1031 stop:1459 length:429 start_codon:yes stop_codon:yes gene_type:complete
MKSISNLSRFMFLGMSILFLLSTNCWSQEIRIKPPKKASKITSVDKFVKHSFELYHKVFVYDSLTKAGVEVPAEIEDELMERAERDVDSLWQEVPDIAEDISDAPFMRQAKATFNLNRSKKALKFCMLSVKAYFIGTEEDED